VYPSIIVIIAGYNTDEQKEKVIKEKKEKKNILRKDSINKKKD
jgi:hypothetical protein